MSVSPAATGLVNYGNYVSESLEIEELRPTEIMIRQEPALKAYDELYSHFEQDKNGNYIYPYNYAGEYIDDNFNLILLVTDDNVELFEHVVSMHDCVKIKKVAYSYFDLQQIIPNVIDKFGDKTEFDDMLVCSYVDIINNHAVIEASENKYKDFQSKYFDLNSILRSNECLSIKLVDYTNDVQTTVSGGTIITGSMGGTAAVGGRYEKRMLC